MNQAETILWDRIRSSKIGFKFRRQHPFGPFFLDFYCIEAKLAIELDGETHAEREAKDASRDAYFAKRGILTLRYRNSEVYGD